MNATKFGFDIDLATGERRGGTNRCPDHVKATADACLKRLRTDRIDLFYQHRVHPDVAIEDVPDALKGSPRLAKFGTTVFRKRAYRQFAAHTQWSHDRR